MPLKNQLNLFKEERPLRDLPYGRNVHKEGHQHWRQSWKMSNLLHGPISTNQILPREKRVNRDIFGTSNLQNRTYGVSCDE